MISDYRYYSHNLFIRFNVVLRFLWVHCISITSTKSNSGLVDWYPHGGLGPHFTTSQLKGPLEKHGLNDCCCGSWKWPGVSQQKSDKNGRDLQSQQGCPLIYLFISVHTYAKIYGNLAIHRVTGWIFILEYGSFPGWKNRSLWPDWHLCPNINPWSWRRTNPLTWHFFV